MSANSHRGRYTHGDSEYVDGMMEHDDTIGTILKALDDMGVANDTIVVYTSDNGPHMNSWPDGAMTWFRSREEHQLGGRLPRAVRGALAGRHQAGTVTNELMSHNDWVPTLCAIAGEPDIVEKLKAGYTANGIDYKVHLDGFNQSEFLRNVSGSAANNNGIKSARDKFFYSDDDGLLVGLPEGRLQIRLLGAAMAGHNGTVGRTVHDASPAEDIQPVPGSVRACRHHVQHLLGLAAQPCWAVSTARWTMSSSSWRHSRISRRARSRRASIRQTSWKARSTISRAGRSCRRAGPREGSRRAEQADRRGDRRPVRRAME